MHSQKWLLILLIILGEIAVLGSYVNGVLSVRRAAEILWGGVPQGIRPHYTLNMLLAAMGSLNTDNQEVPEIASKLNIVGYKTSW
jgi:hypothetical protein